MSIQRTPSIINLENCALGYYEVELMAIANKDESLITGSKILDRIMDATIELSEAFRNAEKTHSNASLQKYLITILPKNYKLPLELFKSIE
ncbi:MAG: hypothetical protein K1060chlam5_01222 [Candidatus Anoxychlamydiales bacterium]|nr:hypothetical protein [Candidatus Anoxychlamydiales bacterium]